MIHSSFCLRQNINNRRDVCRCVAYAALRGNVRVGSGTGVPLSLSPTPEVSSSSDFETRRLLQAEMRSEEDVEES